MSSTIEVVGWVRMQRGTALGQDTLQFIGFAGKSAASELARLRNLAPGRFRSAGWSSSVSYDSHMNSTPFAGVGSRSC